MNQTVLIGADPETFIQQIDASRRQWNVLPAFGLFGGTKQRPVPMKDMPEGFCYLEDNAALEFNIPPQKTAADFVETVGAARRYLRDMVLPKHNADFMSNNRIELTVDHLKDPRSQTVGCEPDHDAYANNGAQRPAFEGKDLGNERYAGGHIHLSYNFDAIPAFVAARFLDLYLTLPWLEYDRQGARRPLYGKAGLFRPKKYGLEYRTPSNWWVWQAERTQQQFVMGAEYFARRSYEPEYLRLLSEAYARFPWSDLQKIIEAEDHDTGQQLIALANRQFRLNVGIQPIPRGRLRPGRG